MILGNHRRRRLQYEHQGLFILVRPSRVAKQAIGPRITRSWLKHLDCENCDVVDTDGIESSVSQDYLAH